MMTIHEVSKLAGVSVRTLHYYDAIGLLPPTALTESGYRLYDDTALARLQSILLSQIRSSCWSCSRRGWDGSSPSPVKHSLCCGVFVFFQQFCNILLSCI